MAVQAPSWEEWQKKMTFTSPDTGEVSAPSSRLRRDYYDNFVREINSGRGDDYARDVIRIHGLDAGDSGGGSSGGGGTSAPRRTALTAPPQTTSPSAPVTAKERAKVSKPAKGLESTIKTTPTLLREKRRRSYLTRG